MQPNNLRKFTSNLISAYETESDDAIREGLLRTSVEKMYYYVFLILREAELALKIKISESSSAHNEVVENLSNILCKQKFLTYKRKLKGLRKERNSATYDLAYSLNLTEVNAMLLNVNKLLEKLSTEPTIGTYVLQFM